MSSGDTSRPDWPAFARRVIQLATRSCDTRRAEPPDAPRHPRGGVFVSLRKGGKLRGCMGTLDPDLPLADAVREAAISAAMHDPRYPTLTPAELAETKVEVSILSAAAPMKDLDELVLGRHGVIVRRGKQQGLFLPQVATDHGLSKEEFLTRCAAEKAHLPPDAWRDPSTEVLLFTSEVFRE